jgi:hypothetical protein
MKKIKYWYRRIKLFLSWIWFPDFFGDPIDVVTAWEVAKISEGEYNANTKNVREVVVR